jgi:hypothetical protein
MAYGVMFEAASQLIENGQIGRNFRLFLINSPIVPGCHGRPNWRRGGAYSSIEESTWITHVAIWLEYPTPIAPLFFLSGIIHCIVLGVKRSVLMNQSFKPDVFALPDYHSIRPDLQPPPGTGQPSIVEACPGAA